MQYWGPSAGVSWQFWTVRGTSPCWCYVILGPQYWRPPADGSWQCGADSTFCTQVWLEANYRHSYKYPTSANIPCPGIVLVPWSVPAAWLSEPVPEICYLSSWIWSCLPVLTIHPLPVLCPLTHLLISLCMTLAWQTFMFLEYPFVHLPICCEWPWPGYCLWFWHFPFIVHICLLLFVGLCLLVGLLHCVVLKVVVLYYSLT